MYNVNVQTMLSQSKESAAQGHKNRTRPRRREKSKSGASVKSKSDVSQDRQTNQVSCNFLDGEKTVQQHWNMHMQHCTYSETTFM